MNWVRDSIFVLGVAAIGAGAYGYDWRIACISVGGVLVATATIAMRST